MGLIITGGTARGRKLRTLGTDSRIVRPTSGKIREALFSMLGTHIHEAKFLDLYAGFGTVGLEALSRGAASANLVENNAAVFSVLKSNVATLGFSDVQLWKKDAARFPVKEGFYDIVFLDPPFQLDFNLGPIVKLVSQWKGAAPIFIVQYPTKTEPEWAESANTIKKYGESSLCIFYN